MVYTTQYGLPQNVVNYLNQQLPTADIYGGITSVPFTFDDVAAEQQIEAQASGTLTPEQLRLLYLQQSRDGGEPRGGGEGRDDDNNIDRTNNLGINSLSDLTGMISTPGIIGGIIGGIPGAIIGRGISNFMDPNRDIFGRLNETGIAAQVANMAQARGIQKRIDAGEFDGPSTSTSKAADNRESRRGGQYNGDGGGKGGSSGSSGSSGGGRDAGMGMGGKTR